MPTIEREKSYAVSAAYIVDPVKEDGSLDAKDPNNCFGTFPAGGVTEDELFNYYFKFHPCSCPVYGGWRDCNCAADWNQLRAFFATKGWKIRSK